MLDSCQIAWLKSHLPGNIREGKGGILAFWVKGQREPAAVDNWGGYVGVNNPDPPTEVRTET